MLNGAGDAHRQVQLGRYRLAGTADLALHGKPAGVADGPGRGQFATQRIGQPLHQGDIVGLFNSTPHGHDDLGGGQIHRALRFAEQIPRRGANLRGRDLGPHHLDACGPGGHLVGPVRARLQGCELRPLAGEAVIRAHFSLEKLPHENHRAVVDAVRNHVADGHAAEGCGQLGQKVAHLIGVREKQDIGVKLGDCLAKRRAIGVRRVVLQ